MLLAAVLSVGLCSCRGSANSSSTSTNGTHSVCVVDSLLKEGKQDYAKGYYANSLNSLTEALKIAESESITTRLPMIYNDIGKVYCTWHHDRLGIEYFKKGLQTSTARQNRDTYCKLLINVQGAAFNLGEMQLMRVYYEEMKQIVPSDSLLQYFLYLNEGLMLRGEGKPHEAMPWFVKAAEYAERKQMDPLLTGSAYGYISDNYETSDLVKAIAYWQKSIADSDVPAYYRRDVLRHLSSISETLGRDAEAVSYSRQYLELSDSLFKEGDMNRARDAQKAYPFKTLARTNLPMRTAGDKKERLDSVVGYNSDGSKYIRMYCEYGPDGLMTKQTNSFWNSETNDWDHLQVYEYAWDQDGYCLRMSNFAYGYGERMDFKYNDDKLCIEQIKYNAESDGVWKQWYKGEYEYDAKGNMTAEKGCLWDGTQWNDSFRTTATYDENNLMTGIESYEYIDGVWRGSEKQEYVNFTANKLSDKYMYRWDDAEAKWVSAQHFIQEWSSQGHLLAQRMRYWNADDQSWNGDYSSWGTSEICKNYDAEMEYDDKWRITRQAHTDWYNKGAEKHLSSEMITKWTDNADGTSQSEMNAFLYSYPDNKKIWNQRQYKKFDVNDSIIWDNQQLGNYDGTAMLDYYETKYAYDEQGHCIYEATWDFDEDGRRIPSIEQRDVYNDQNQIIEQTFRMNANGGGMEPFTSARRVPEITDEDNEGWVYSSHFTYEHDHDITISKLKYKWNVGNGEWMPSDGSVVKFDFKMPASDIILPIDYVDLYKIEKIDNYTGDGIGSD